MSGRKSGGIPDDWRTVRLASSGEEGEIIRNRIKGIGKKKRRTSVPDAEAAARKLTQEEGPGAAGNHDRFFGKGERGTSLIGGKGKSSRGTGPGLNGLAKRGGVKIPLRLKLLTRSLRKEWSGGRRRDSGSATLTSAGQWEEIN